LGGANPVAGGAGNTPSVSPPQGILAQLMLKHLTTLVVEVVVLVVLEKVEI